MRISVLVGTEILNNSSNSGVESKISGIRVQKIRLVLGKIVEYYTNNWDFYSLSNAEPLQCLVCS